MKSYSKLIDKKNFLSFRQLKSNYSFFYKIEKTFYFVFFGQHLGRDRWHVMLIYFFFFLIFCITI